MGEIVDLIHQSLYEQFAEPDLFTSAKAYAELFAALGLSSSSHWVCATTNYDFISEHAIQEAGWLPEWGEPPQVGSGSNGPINVDGLITTLPRYVPVLHLHGRIGWYRRIAGDGSSAAYSTPSLTHNRGNGIPIIALPDRRRRTRDPILVSLWSQFTEALGRARGVLVLGHSLNDEALVAALRENIEPPERLAVTVLTRESDGALDESATPIIELNRTELRGAIIPMRFGHPLSLDQSGLTDWRRRVGL